MLRNAKIVAQLSNCNSTLCQLPTATVCVELLFREGSPWWHISKGVTDPTRIKKVLFGFWDINQSFFVPWNLWPMKKELIKVTWDLFWDASMPYDFMAEWNKQWWFHASSASVNFRQYLSGKLGETIYELYGYGSRGKVMRIYLDIIWHICFFKCIPFVKGQKVHNRKEWKYTANFKCCLFLFFGGKKHEKTDSYQYINLHAESF